MPLALLRPLLLLRAVPRLVRAVAAALLRAVPFPAQLRLAQPGALRREGEQGLVRRQGLPLSLPRPPQLHAEPLQLQTRLGVQLREAGEGEGEGG